MTTMQVRNKIVTYALFIIAIVFVILHTGTATAQELQTNPGLDTGLVACSGAVGQKNGLPSCNWCTFVQTIGNVVQYSIYLAVILSALVFTYAGFLFLTNNGNPENITKAWSIFRRALLGTIAILAAWLIVNAIMTKLATGLGLGEEWNSLKGCANVTLDTNPYDSIPYDIPAAGDLYPGQDYVPAGNAYTDIRFSGSATESVDLREIRVFR